MHDQTIPALERAITNIQNGAHFDYWSWGHCACGHIYKGATGQTGAVHTVRQQPSGPYAAVIKDVAKVLGWKPGLLRRDPSHAVGHVSLVAANRINEGAKHLRSHRTSVLEMLQGALRTLKAQQATDTALPIEEVVPVEKRELVS